MPTTAGPATYVSSTAIASSAYAVCTDAGSGASRGRTTRVTAPIGGDSPPASPAIAMTSQTGASAWSASTMATSSDASPTPQIARTATARPRSAIRPSTGETKAVAAELAAVARPAAAYDPVPSATTSTNSSVYMPIGSRPTIEGRATRATPGVPKSTR